MTGSRSDPLYERPLAELIPQLRDRRVSAAELADAVCERYRRCAGPLNAYKYWDNALLRDMARAADAALVHAGPLGPLTGVPVSVKDHFGVRGLPIFAGTARELPERFRAEGPIVTALRRQLAIFGGKTHSVEMAFGGIGTNAHWGAPRNPWDATAERVSGGSSSGAGVSLQTGTAWVALGTDTGGSVRIPASMTGCVGLKTSTGRWSLDGIVPLSATLDTAGILTRSVADAVYGFAALDPRWRGDADALFEHARVAIAGLRIGIADGPMWDDCQDDVAAVVKTALDELAAAGARVSSVPLPEARDAIELLRNGSVVSAECDAFIESELPAWRALLEPTVTMRINDGGAIPAREYLQRRHRLTALARIAERRFDDAGVDVLAAPTLPLSPPLLAEVADLDGYRPRNAAALSNTCVGNFLNLCGLSFPAGLDRLGLPAGLMLLARNSRDEALLAAGLAVERTLGAPRRRLGRPPLCS